MAKDTFIRINPQDMANLKSAMKKLENWIREAYPQKLEPGLCTLQEMPQH